MTEIAIHVEGLGKRYHIGERQRYKALRDTLSYALCAPYHAAASLLNGHRPTASSYPSSDHFWALRDVSFDVRKGEAVGIIGRNGAGKSTLLKILSRITKPTEGYVRIHGRVGSLLEVGTGFHPELTGRENIYLNGAIIGMRKKEINRKFDEIVAFAEIEKFIDTPVKFYSSGMYVRLAFAVAAHLEPEILLVDEVLAVGDAAFQKKCLGQMGKVAKEGRTVLLVSHNMVAIESLCKRALLLDQGKLGSTGDTKEVLQRYLTFPLDDTCGRKSLLSHPGRSKESLTIMTQVTLFSNLEVPSYSVRMGSPFAIEVAFQSASNPVRPVLGVVILDKYGSPLFGVNNRFISGYKFTKPVSKGTITCHFDRIPLMPGNYIVDLYFGDDRVDLDVVHGAISFDVTPADVFGTGRLPPASAGPIFWPASWSLQENGAINR
jgi:lipopolysaccharide transport system ATP-binding protein